MLAWSCSKSFKLDFNSPWTKDFQRYKLSLAIWCKELTHWKDPDAGKDWRQEEKGATEDKMVQLSSFQLLACVQLFATSWTAPCQASLSITNSGAYSNSCPLSWWFHLAIASFVIPFSHLQSFPASGSFQISQFFTSGGRSTGVAASASVLPMNIQDWLPLG